MHKMSRDNLGFRWLARGGLLLALTIVVISTVRTWILTEGAALDWRLRVLTPDAIGGLLVAIGFAFAGFGTPAWRRAGWSLVGLVLLSVIVWIAVAVFG